MYIVKCSDGSLYTGIATDVRRRVCEHNSSALGAKYTRGRRPVVLIYSEKTDGRSAAQKREAQIKRLPKKAKLVLAGIDVTDKTRQEF